MRLRRSALKSYARLDLLSYRRIFEDQSIFSQTAARLCESCGNQQKKNRNSLHRDSLVQQEIAPLRSRLGLDHRGSKSKGCGANPSRDRKGAVSDTTPFRFRLVRFGYSIERLLGTAA